MDSTSQADGSAASVAAANGDAAAETTPVCPRFHAAVELIGKRWAGAILWMLLERPHYFAELSAAIPGVSDRLLSTRLRELETEGLVERRVHDGSPARVSYALTETGSGLEPSIRSLHEWAQGWDGNGALVAVRARRQAR